jgi:Ca-activated chloride channel family protein
VGIGSPAGVPIPERNAYGNLIGYKKDKDGNVVTTVLDEATLQRISLETGGRYFRASAGQSELGAIFKEIEAIEKKVIKTESYTQFEERYQYFLGLAIAFLLVEFILPERRLKKK